MPYEKCSVPKQRIKGIKYLKPYFMDKHREKKILTNR